MTKQELYLQLCLEAGSYDGVTGAEQWWDDCAHNRTLGQEQVLSLAAEGDVAALVKARMDVGLAPLV